MNMAHEIDSEQNPAHMENEKETRRAAGIAYIRQVMAEKTKKPSNIAAEIGVVPSTINRYVPKDPDKASSSVPDIDTLTLIRDHYGVPFPDELMRAYRLKKDSSPQDSSGVNPPLSNVRIADLETPDFFRLPKNVPIYGVAECGEGQFTMDENRVNDYARRMPGIATNKAVFAIYLTGTSMEPAMHAGDLVYLDPNREPQVGRYVVVQMRPKREGDEPACMLKVLTRRTGEYYELRQFNPEKTFRVKAADVMKVYRVLTNGDLHGA